MPGDPRDPSTRAAPVGAEGATVPTIGGGRYALESKIAEGGMAGVYRARDNDLRVWRAIKVLLPDFAERKAIRTRFVREAHAMARLDHENVIRVYDVGADGPLPYIVMDLTEGGTLIEWCETHGTMPPRLAVDVMIQVARGVHAAHRAGIVHRDIKPHNVLIDTDGTCRVTDFGIARIAAADGMTRTGSTMGTIGYMAPEQRADAKNVDVRADVYSLGALLYKLLTNTVVTDLFLVEHEPALLERVPEALHEVLLRACFHDRDRRYPDAEHLEQALREVRDALPPDPRDTPPLPLEPPDASLDGPPGPEQFSEIAEMFAGGSLPPSAPPEPRAQADTSPVLPYTMPRLDRRTPSPAAAPEPAPEPGLDDTVEGLEAPRPAVVTPLVDEVTELEPASASPMLRVLALAALIAWVLLASLGAAGAWETSSRAEAEGIERRALYSVLSAEQGTLAELARYPVPESELDRLSALYDRFEAADDEPTRLQAAATFGAGVDAAITEHDAGGIRATNVQNAWRDWRDAREAWREAASSMSGRIAVGVGLAPRP